MGIIATSDLREVVAGHYLLLDSDFLSELYENQSFQKEFLLATKESDLLLDQFVAFEFLNGVFDPRYLQAKEKFVDYEAFLPTVNQTEVFKTVINNALLLSKIYALKGKAKGVSMTDLFLAARLMGYYSSSLIITGNKRHYPSCVFKLITVINIESTTDESIKNFCVLKFDHDLFSSAMKDLQKVGK